MAKSCQKVVKKVVKKLSKKSSKNCQKKLAQHSKPKIENLENLQERHKEKRKTLIMMNARHP
jgi:hypothetical protein